MANRTLKDAKNIHGTNPQYLVEKIIRSRIYDSQVSLSKTKQQMDYFPY